MKLMKTDFEKAIDQIEQMLLNAGYFVVWHTGKIADAHNRWKHLATEMLDEGWYLVNLSIPQVVYLTEDNDMDETQAEVMAIIYLTWEMFAQ